MPNLHETLSQILEGYRANIVNYDRTVDLLEALYKRLQYINDQKIFFDVLRSERPAPAGDTPVRAKSP